MSDNSDQSKKEGEDEESPSVKSQPVEGKITADEKSGYMSTLMAYDSMINKAKNISKEIIKCLKDNNAKILMVDSLDFCESDIQFIQISFQLVHWKKLIEEQIGAIKIFINKIEELLQIKVKPEEKEKLLGIVATETALTSLTGILGPIADIVGYFRVDYDIKGQTINLSNSALKTLVAGQIKKPDKINVYFPCFHRLISNDNIKIISELNDCISLKNELWNQINELQTNLAYPKVDEIKKNGNDEQKKLISDTDANLKKAKDLISEFAIFAKEIISTPEKGSYSPLANAIIRQYLDDNKFTHLLYVAVVSGGGEMILGKGLFMWGKVGYLGGCVINYVLAKCDGEIVLADTVYDHSYSKYNLCNNKLEKLEGEHQQ